MCVSVCFSVCQILAGYAYDKKKRATLYKYQERLGVYVCVRERDWVMMVGWTTVSLV